jgi:hypothetical protein
MIPFCNLSVCKYGVVAACDTGRKAASNVVVGWVKTFFVACWVVFVLPIAVLGYRILVPVLVPTDGRLTLVEREPDRYIFIITSNDKFCIVKEIIHDFRIGPSSVGIEECEWCVY